MPDKHPKDMTRAELLTAARLHPAPAQDSVESPAYGVPPGKVTIDQYLALRGVPEHRRAARRAFAGTLRVASVDEFDRVFATTGRREP